MADMKHKDVVLSNKMESLDMSIQVQIWLFKRRVYKFSPSGKGYNKPFYLIHTASLLGMKASL